MFSLNFAFKNVVSRKSSLVIILFIAFSIMVLIMANSVFDGTRTGIEKTFSGNFTGDIVVRPKTDFPMSLFGDETPVTGSLSELPSLFPYQDVRDYVKNHPAVDHCVSQISGQAILRIDGDNVPVYMFGVDASQYSELMEGIHILEGVPYEDDEHKVMMSTQLIRKIKDSTDVELHCGDSVQMISTNGSSYTIRSAEISAIYEYAVESDLQDNILLIDPDTLRSLIGLTSSSSEAEIDTENTTLLDDFDSIDDLFGDFGMDEELSESADQNIDTKKESLSVEETVQFNDDENETIWNYLVVDLKDKSLNTKAVIRQMNRYFSKKEWPVQAVDWRAAAGMAAQYIYWMRLIFNIGIIIIIGTGFIVVNNTLVIAALDRTRETGALRAIGAGRNFVALQYLLETMLLTVTAGIAGCILGVIGTSIFLSGGISFTNSYLIQLFGGNTLHTTVTISNLAGGMVLALILGFIAWVYSVRIALEASPVVAMEAVR